MHAFHQPNEPGSRLRKRLIFGMLLLVLLGTAGTVCVLWKGWSVALQRAQSQVVNTAILIDHDVGSTLDKVIVALGAVVAELERELPSPEFQRHTLWALADDTTALVPEISGIYVFDALGRQVCAVPMSRCQHIDVADRPYFMALRDEPGSGRKVFAPIRSRADNRWSLVVAQRLHNAAGEFGGIAVALVPLEIFKKLIASLDLGTAGAVSLRMDDLLLAARHPGHLRADDEEWNRRVSPELLVALKSNPVEGTYRAVTLMDGIERQNAYRRLARHPLVVIVGLGIDDVLAGWHTHVWWALSFLMVFIGTSAAVVVLLLREMRHRERLHEELELRVRERTQEVRALAGELEMAENRERQRLARDLHDDLAQTLAAARIRLERLCQSRVDHVREAACRVAELVDQADRSTRSLAAQLAPAVLYELGLAPALERLGEEIWRDFGIHVAISDDLQPKPLTPEARSILYRCARELLVNAAKHALAGQIDVDIEVRDGCLFVTVSDSGIGFDTAQPHAGTGLRSVRERLSYIGGMLEIRSRPGEGTQAVLSAPLNPGEPAAPAARPATPARTA